MEAVAEDVPQTTQKIIVPRNYVESYAEPRVVHEIAELDFPNIEKLQWKDKKDIIDALIVTVRSSTLSNEFGR